MQRFEVRYISGHTLKLTIREVEAENEEQAIDKAFEIEGHNFENRLVSVEKID
jgi:hypothetical protein